jgi:hypothetical protein
MSGNGRDKVEIKRISQRRVLADPTQYINMGSETAMYWVIQYISSLFPNSTGDSN